MTPSSSQASSPGLSPSGFGQPCPFQSAASSPPRFAQHGLYLSPPYDFGHVPPYGTAPTAQGYLSKYAMGGWASPSSSAPNLTPSSSHSSLCSMQSTASSAAADVTLLSDRSRKELKAYAVSFEQVRLRRRRSQ